MALIRLKNLTINNNRKYLLPMINSCKILDYFAVTNQNIGIMRNCDIFKLNAFEIPINCDENDFRDFIVSIGECQIWNIPFRLIYYLSEKFITDDHKIILFPDNLFLNQHLTIKELSWGLPVNYLNYHPLNIILTSDKKIYYTLKTTSIYINDTQKFWGTELLCRVNQYQKQKINSNKVQTNFCFKTTGIFLEIFEEIKHIKIKIDACTLIDYNACSLFRACDIIYEFKWTKLHKKALYESLPIFIPKEIKKIIKTQAKKFMYILYWIPFIARLEWNSQYSEGILDLEGNHSNITILFDKKIKANIYYKIYNLLKFADGMGELLYHY